MKTRKAGNESDRFSKRLKRYVRVSGAVAGAGARVAGRRLTGGAMDREETARLLAGVFGGLKGPVMKVAQLLAVVPGLLPQEYSKELAKLQSYAPPMCPSFVKRRMTAELGSGWPKKFKKFDMNPAYAASLGQVHKALALDGRRLACKLQYQDMAPVVEADLRQLKLALKLFELFDGAVSTQQAYEEIADRLREEFDYGLEAKRIGLFRAMLKGVSGVHVPDVVRDLSTRRLLTMTWLDGKRFEDVVKQRSQTDRNAIAENIFRAWYRPFFGYGVIHGDPHSGNYTFRPGNGINLLDFGCVRVFRPDLVQAVINLYKALRDDDRDLAVEAYKAWGFHNPSNALVDVLHCWSQFIYSPFLINKARLIGPASSVVYGRETAFAIHKELKKIGGVSVPRPFVFIDRASLGLGSVFLRLRARINWHRMLEELISDFTVEKLAAKQHKVLNENDLLPGRPS